MKFLVLRMTRKQKRNLVRWYKLTLQFVVNDQYVLLSRSGSLFTDQFIF